MEWDVQVLVAEGWESFCSWLGSGISQGKVKKFCRVHMYFSKQPQDPEIYRFSRLGALLELGPSIPSLARGW
ncbi:hypothetical protein NC652_006198 [Populus alba x Populus x berolinensis]|nr:hypothetical protein NC652_006198 [Populus alba x Populus x berolinensis]